ncbi:MAG: hypothetical protein KGS61_03585 [Verrucomicrobia bacterium]|nr:hypothetical protein [Verrucomicrobiota bacterium]
MSDRTPSGFAPLAARPPAAAGPNRRPDFTGGGGAQPGYAAAAAVWAATESAPAVSPEFWALVDVVWRRWWWIALSAGVLGLAAFLAGLKIWHNAYSVEVELIRYDSPNTQEVFPPRPTSAQTFAAVMKSPEVLERVSAKANPPLSADDLDASLKLVPDRNSDLLTILLKRDRRQGLVELANLYAREAVRLTQVIQANAAAEVNVYLTSQLAEVDKQIAALREKLGDQQFAANEDAQSPSFAPVRPVTIERLQENLAAARDALSDLLGKFTEAMPSVQYQRAKIASLEKQLAELMGRAATNSPAGNHGAAGDATASARLPLESDLAHQAADDLEARGQIQTLENNRLLLAQRQRAAQLFVNEPPGYYRLFSPATAKDVVVHRRILKVAFLGIFGGVVGALLTISALLLVEVLDNRLKTVADVARVTHLPLIAGLGNLRQMDPTARNRWAFRTWTALQHRLCASPNQGLICGITSAQAGEGRSTWLNLLAQAASQRGFRVLTIATRPSAAHPATADQLGDHSGQVAQGVAQRPDAATAPNTDSEALTTNVLASPAEVAQRLVGPDPQPHVHIPLPGWVWNLKRRQQWKSALNHWGRINNLVILVELPPACMPEAVLLAENVPNLLWLIDSGSSSASETRAQLETLSHSRCNLVGALLNHEPASTVANRFPRWFAGLNGHPH